MSTHHYASTLAAEIMARALARSATAESAPASEIETVPECKIIRADGTSEIVTERPRLEVAWKFGPGPEIHPKRASALPVRAQPRITKPPRVPKPRRPRRGKPISLRQKAWSRPDVTIEDIIAMQRRGMTMPEIAAAKQCGYCTISDRIRAARRLKHPEYLAMDADLRVCRCGSGKQSRSRLCAKCKEREHRIRHPRRKYPAYGYDSLRPRQLRLAELAATGARLPEIAAALGLARASAKTELGNIYRQLEVHSREEFVRWWADHVERTAAQMPIAGARMPQDQSVDGSVGKEARESL